jgi:protein-L-isoaspartate(D-aspartate) O-methyltransferase
MSWQDILSEDDYRFYKENISLLEDQVIQKFSEGQTDPGIVSAIRNVPRHFFVHQGYKKLAYTDNAFPTFHGLTTSAPSVIAKMIYYSGAKRGDRVLEIGTGTGYQAAVLAEMGMHVFSIEIDKGLVRTANTILVNLGYKPGDGDEHIRRLYNLMKTRFPGRGDIRLFYGNGTRGLKEYAPFKAIIIAASLSHPQSLAGLVGQLSAHDGSGCISWKTITGR